MNNKMTKIHLYQQLNVKNKPSNQEQRQNHGHGERFDGCQMEGGVGNGRRGEGIKKYKSVVTE